ncbi:hypothetical protein HDV03_004155 [Kappamyces sp. JEL0829]|nr:hypothetical protein HDV03_004155 [Kappamyces sp. JEL0829]
MNCADSVCYTCDSRLAAPLQCSACKSAAYCGVVCQRKDWKRHKMDCRPASRRLSDSAETPPVQLWMDNFRTCEDGSRHEGRLELVTWSGTFQDLSLGWGAFAPDECEEAIARYTGAEFQNGNDALFHAYSPHSYRWTCCGTPGDSNLGCDHHGSSSAPCTCDFCIAGQPIPQSTWDDHEYYRRGLVLSRGPDVRSFDAAKAADIREMRKMVGMDDFGAVTVSRSS